MTGKRKGSSKYKPVKRYTKHAKGDRRIYYLKNWIPYQFKVVNEGREYSNLQVHARTKQEAIKKAKGWERWLRKKAKREGWRGTERVDFSKGIWKWNERLMKFIKMK